MAAYAAVACLMNTMEHIRNHPRLPTSFDNNQIQSLGEDLDFILEYVESYTYYYGCARKEVKDLERRIVSAAHAAEDVIESYVVDQIQAGFAQKIPSPLVDLQNILEDMSVIKEVVARAKEEMPHYIKVSTPAAPHIRRGSRIATMVGLEDSLEYIVGWLIGESQEPEIITIIGPPSSGKTTLARHAYSSPFTKKHFYYRAWANVCADENVREILLQLLSCLGRSTHKLVKLHEDELGREFKLVNVPRLLLI